jgi:hypothetical protein
MNESGKGGRCSADLVQLLSRSGTTDSAGEASVVPEKSRALDNAGTTDCAIVVPECFQRWNNADVVHEMSRQRGFSGTTDHTSAVGVVHGMRGALGNSCTTKGETNVY